ncbi:MAG: hypothetical protein AAGM22_06065 [Acidobacteriota bacterium]
MGPFDITHWSDYVRDLVDGHTKSKMEAQLERDDRARHTVEALRRVSDVARKDLDLEIPDGVLHSVYALSGTRRAGDQPAAETFLEGLRRSVMSLSFDSAMAPAMAGVRDAQSLNRQLFYELDDVAVELRHEPHRSGGVVVGQLVRLGDEPQPLSGVEVLAASGDQIITRLSTGPLGEFQADQLPAEDLHFFFLLEHSCLEVPLPQNDR